MPRPDSTRAATAVAVRPDRGTPKPQRASSTDILEMLVAIVEPLAEALGQDTEVVLHDLDKVPNSIVALGGNLTGRSLGGPITDLLLRHIKQGQFDNLLRYPTRSRGGRVLLSSTIFVKDSSARPIACLCVNTDVTEWSHAHDLLERFISSAAPTAVMTRPDPTQEDRAHGENFAQTVEELTVSTVREVIASIGVPVNLMQKQHKFDVVRQLDELGFFLIRDAVDYVAEALDVTRYTIYNYLSDLKPTSDTGPQGQRRATSRHLPLRRHDRPTNA